jgi:hypothetical protein
MADEMLQEPTQVPEIPADAPAQEQEPARQEPVADVVSIPAQQLEPYGGRNWHKALEYAKAGRDVTESGYMDTISTLRSAGITPDQFAEWWSSTQTEEPEITPTPTFDPNQIKEYVSEAVSGAIQTERQKAALDSAWAQEMGFKDETIKSVVGNEELAPVARGLLDSMIDEAMMDELPVTATQAEREAIKRTPASASAKAKAKERFEARWTDIKNIMVSDVREAQKKIPNGTLDGGHGGNAPQKPFDQMTKAERAEYMTGLLGISDD